MSLSRTELLEERVAQMESKMEAMFDALREAFGYAGRPLPDGLRLPPKDRHGLALVEEVAELRARLDGQDQAWAAWADATGIGITFPQRPARDRRGMHVVGGDAS